MENELQLHNCFAENIYFFGNKAGMVREPSGEWYVVFCACLSVTVAFLFLSFVCLCVCVCFLSVCLFVGLSISSFSFSLCLFLSFCFPVYLSVSPYLFIYRPSLSFISSRLSITRRSPFLPKDKKKPLRLNKHK